MSLLRRLMLIDRAEQHGRVEVEGHYEKWLRERVALRERHDYLAGLPDPTEPERVELAALKDDLFQIWLCTECGREAHHSSVPADHGWQFNCDECGARTRYFFH